MLTLLSGGVYCRTLVVIEWTTSARLSLLAAIWVVSRAFQNSTNAPIFTTSMSSSALWRYAKYVTYTKRIHTEEESQLRDDSVFSGIHQ